MNIGGACVHQPQRSMIATSLRGGARRTTGEELPVSMVVNTGHDIRFLTLAYKSSSLVPLSSLFLSLTFPSSPCCHGVQSKSSCCRAAVTD